MRRPLKDAIKRIPQTVRRKIKKHHIKHGIKILKRVKENRPDVWEQVKDLSIQKGKELASRSTSPSDPNWRARVTRYSRQTALHIGQEAAKFDNVIKVGEAAVGLGIAGAIGYKVYRKVQSRKRKRAREQRKKG